MTAVKERKLRLVEKPPVQDEERSGDGVPSEEPILQWNLSYNPLLEEYERPGLFSAPHLVEAAVELGIIAIIALSVAFIANFQI